MKEAAFDPARLDLDRLARDAARIDGVLPGASMARLAQDALAAPGPVNWAARAERRAVTGGVPQLWLHVEADCELTLTCQRCLQPLPLKLTVARPLRFVADEAEAQRLDEVCDEDVLTLPAQGLDLPALLEDELILALPLVAMHDSCPQPLSLHADADAPAANPFQVLEALKRPRSA